MYFSDRVFILNMVYLNYCIIILLNIIIDNYILLTKNMNMSIKFECLLVRFSLGTGCMKTRTYAR